MVQVVSVYVHQAMRLNVKVCRDVVFLLSLQPYLTFACSRGGASTPPTTDSDALSGGCGLWMSCAAGASGR
jgi:hypothetical protein